MILESSRWIVEFLQESAAPATTPTVVTIDALERGFGSAPKFPRPVVFNFLLRYFHRTGEIKARDMVLARAAF